MQTYHLDEPPLETTFVPGVLSGFSPYDDDPDVDDPSAYYTFERILQLVEGMYPCLQKEDAQDIAAELQASLWKKLQEGAVDDPKAYITQMIHNKCIDRWRKYRHRNHIQFLSLSKVQETLENEVVSAPTEGMADPAKEFERKEAERELLTALVDALVDLPPRQQQSMVCFLLLELDDPCQFAEVCQAHSIDIRGIHCPTNKADKDLLAASRYHARQFLARRLGIKLSPHKRKERSQPTRPRIPARSRSRSSHNVSSSAIL